MSLAVGTALGSYRITALLGVGGMGEVYRAHDSNLGRDVAIKVLPESVAKDPEALARFDREARAVAALSHPNIRGIHDLVRHGDVVFAVMELLEGEPLRAHLNGPLPEKLALDYALQTARGLAAAHQKGIVHRDLKPENLFVTHDGYVKILDFGLAKRETFSKPGQSLQPTQPLTLETEPGMIVGTLTYMSPEQVRGAPVDHRSDIFSFGAVLYEMLSGRKAFHRDTAAETMSAILRDEPPEDASISPPLAQLVRHCVEKRADDRFQSAKDIAYDLAQLVSGTLPGHLVSARVPRPRWALAATLGGLLAAVLVLALVVKVRKSPPAEPSAPPGPKRIAVLPFENLGAADQDYFADGVADEVRGKLTSLASLAVIARGSSTPYRKTTKTPQQIARELGVSYILTGTIRWDKTGRGRVQVMPELVEMKSEGAPEARWQERFEADLTDVFRVQSDIATRVAGALGTALGSADVQRFADKPTTNLEAYDAFLKGEESSGSLSRLDPPNLRAAIGHYEKAVALDPSFALAWANLGRARCLLYDNSTPTPDLAASAREAGEKALALDPRRAEGYLALGDHERTTRFDNLRAIEWYEKARSIAPRSAPVLSAVAVANQSLGRWEPVVGELQQAVRLDPLSVATHRRLGNTFLWLRRHTEAQQSYERALSLAPEAVDVIEYLAMVYLARGDLAGARRVLQSAPRGVDRTALAVGFAAYWDLGWVLDGELRDILLSSTPAAFDDDRAAWAYFLALEHDASGDAAKARQLAGEAAAEFRRQVAASPNDPQRHGALGVALALTGKKAEAIREGERAVALGPVEKDAFLGPYIQHTLVRIYVLSSEPEKALDVLEPLLKRPYFLTPAWLRIDPLFEPLRTNPRFQRLAGSASR